MAHGFPRAAAATSFVCAAGDASRIASTNSGSRAGGRPGPPGLPILKLVLDFATRFVPIKTGYSAAYPTHRTLAHGTKVCRTARLLVCASW